MQGREQTDCFEYALAVLCCLKHDINYPTIIREQVLDVCQWWLGIITCLGVIEECLLGSVMKRDGRCGRNVCHSTEDLLKLKQIVDADETVDWQTIGVLIHIIMLSVCR
jgi:hypothetical protein